MTIPRQEHPIDPDEGEGEIDPNDDFAAKIAKQDEDEQGVPPATYRTRGGRELTDADIEELADEAERGYDLGDPKHPDHHDVMSDAWDARSER